MKKYLPLLLLLAGCSKLTVENYNQVKTGMSYDEVSTLLGSATTCDEVLGLRNCVWQDGDKKVEVAFAGDKAMAFSHKGLK